jgi:hypothetical protein
VLSKIGTAGEAFFAMFRREKPRMSVIASHLETIAAATPRTAQSRAVVDNAPTWIFWAMAALLLGSAAFASSSGMLSEPSNRDIWQHAAALRSLIGDPVNPANPFVASAEGSRHYHPWWVGWAFVARTFGLTQWNVLALSAFASMAIFATGVFLFARAYFRSAWGPLILLLTMTMSWMLPIEHTGFHSPVTLMFGAFYPATLLIGLSFLLWALTIHALQRSGASFWIVGLTAFMFATHQLGAAIGVIGAACFTLCWRETTIKSRLIVSVSIAAGLLMSALWPYHNPLLIVFNPGNSSWEGGPDFYGVLYIVVSLIPAAVGLLGLMKFSVPQADRSVLLGVVAFASLYLAGLTGVQIFARFLMPLVLFLHIGLATFFLHLFTTPSRESSRKPWIALGAILSIMHWAILLNAYDELSVGAPESVYAAADQLLRDVPDSHPVAALDVVAWPIVATGQKVLSVPWPEPMIHDLSDRQAETKMLFDPVLPKNTRIERARKLGVRTLIVDERYTNIDTLKILYSHSKNVKRVNPLLRFDLNH